MSVELCSTCLSKHRTLVPLSAIRDISAHLKTIYVVDAWTLVCWECRATLQKMQTFIDKASKAQELLKGYVENTKSPETLQSLSTLSVNIKTDYDENIVYCLKRETVGVEDCDNLQSAVKYDQNTEECIIKIEKLCDDEFQDDSELADVSVGPCCVSAEHEASDDEEPLITRVRRKKVKHKSGGPKKDFHDDRSSFTRSSVHRVGAYQRYVFRCAAATRELYYPNGYLFFKLCALPLPLQFSDSTIPKKNKIEKCKSKIIEEYETKSSKDEEKFIIKEMTIEEVLRLREEDRNHSRYASCPFKCDTCITGYFSEDRFKAHMAFRHSEEIGPYTCDICQRRFRVAANLLHHHAVHLRSYQCRECNVTSHRLSTMLTHSFEHALRKYSCKVCGISFLKERQMRYHREKMHKEQPACSTCGKTFVNGNVMRKHVLLVHSNTPKQPCPQCGRAVRNLRAHLATHAPPAPDAFCVECGRSFRNRLTYRRHLLMHRRHRHEDDVLKYVCSSCSGRFSNKTSLDRHVAARHTKQYPFNCDVCSKGFSRRDRLQFHILERHEGGQRPREEICSYCGKGFKTKQVLIHHVRTHTGEKPYKCEHCPWSFAQRSTLKTHARALHGNTGGDNNTGGGGNTGSPGKTDCGGNIVGTGNMTAPTQARNPTDVSTARGALRNTLR